VGLDSKKNPGVENYGGGVHVKEKLQGLPREPKTKTFAWKIFLGARKEEKETVRVSDWGNVRLEEGGVG